MLIKDYLCQSMLSKCKKKLASGVKPMPNQHANHWKKNIQLRRKKATGKCNPKHIISSYFIQEVETSFKARLPLLLDHPHIRVETQHLSFHLYISAICCTNKVSV